MALVVQQNTREAGPVVVPLVEGRQQPPPEPPAAAQNPTPPAPAETTPAAETPPEADAPTPSAPTGDSDDAAETTDDTPAPEEGSEDDAVTVREHQRQRPARRRPDAEARIKELTTARYDLLRENQRLAAQLDILVRTQQQGQPAPAAPSTVPGTPPDAAASAEPQEEDFASHTEWVKAYARWELQHTLPELRAAIKAELHAEQAQERQATVQQGWDVQVTQARQTYDDFDPAFHDPTIRFRPDLVSVVQEAVASSPQGHALLYTLLTDPALRAEMEERTPQGAKKLLQATLEGLTTPPARSQAPPPPQRTPRPAAPTTTVTPVLGTGSSTPIRQDPASIAQHRGSLADYMRARGPYRP